MSARDSMSPHGKREMPSTAHEQDPTLFPRHAKRMTRRKLRRAARSQCRREAWAA